MGVAKSDFLRCVGADQILIENAEHFARIDLDLSDFEKERTQCVIKTRHRSLELRSHCRSDQLEQINDWGVWQVVGVVGIDRASYTIIFDCQKVE